MNNLGKYEAQLMPCPFCGFNASMHKALIDVQDSPYYMARITCDDCDLVMDGPYEKQPNHPRAEMEWEAFETRIKSDLARRWNTRVVMI